MGQAVAPHEGALFWSALLYPGGQKRAKRVKAVNAEQAAGSMESQVGCEKGSHESALKICAEVGLWASSGT